MKSFKLILACFLAPLFAAWDRFLRPRGSIALANIVAAGFEQGRESFTVDPSVSFPVSTKYLLYERGSAYNYAKLADGGATLTSLPLGPSPDAPYQAGDILTIYRLGAVPGTVFVQAAAAVAIDHLVVSSGSGLVSDVATVANGTYWACGRSMNSVSAAGMEVVINACDPYLITVTAGVLTLPTNQI